MTVAYSIYFELAMAVAVAHVHPPEWKTAAATLSDPRRAPAQAAVSLHLTAANLDEVVQALAEQTGIACALDCEAPARTCSIDFDGPAEKAFDRVATAFKYSWRLGKGRSVIFTRQFVSADDLPQVHLADALRVCDDTLRVINPGAHPPRRRLMSGPLNSLADSLTPAQLEALRGRTFLPATNLDSGQFQLLSESQYHLVLGPSYDIWQPLFDELGAADSWSVSTFGPLSPVPSEHVSPSRIQVTWKDMAGRHTSSLLRPFALAH